MFDICQAWRYFDRIICKAFSIDAWLMESKMNKEVQQYTC